MSRQLQGKLSTEQEVTKEDAGSGRESDSFTCFGNDDTSNQGTMRE